MIMLIYFNIILRMLIISVDTVSNTLSFNISLRQFIFLIYFSENTSLYLAKSKYDMMMNALLC